MSVIPPQLVIGKIIFHALCIAKGAVAFCFHSFATVPFFAGAWGAFKRVSGTPQRLSGVFS